jgi:hypothetical protein
MQEMKGLALGELQTEYRLNYKLTDTKTNSRLDEEKKLNKKA